MDDKVILKLVDAALSGDKHLGQMAVRQFASKIRLENTNLYKRITEKLHVDAIRSTELQRQPLPVDADTRQNLVRMENPVLLDKSPVYSSDVEESLRQILLERHYTEKLMAEGILPTRSVIFQGAPGVGKTMSARWLAKNLQLPLLTLDLATVMSSFLGKTGSNVRSVLEYAMSTPCVLLLDEFDAVAKRRDDDRELGELKRLVTVLLQAIDDWPPSSLLIAATNHGELLDPAIWRRFDVEITFPMPSIDVIDKYLIEYWPEALKNGRSAKHFSGMSFSNIDRELRQAKREQILSSFSALSSDKSTTESNVNSEVDFRSLNREDRDKWILKLFNEGSSQRSIAKKLGISRPTVKRVLDNSLQI